MLGWTMTQVEESGAAGCDALAECRALLAERTVPCGRRNPLCGALCVAPAASGLASRRRVCCLRYRLPGVPSCGNLCPLTAAQQAAGAADPCDA